MLQTLGGHQDLEVRLPSLSCLMGAMRFKVSNSFREETEKDLQRRERRVCDASAQYQRQRGSDDQAASLSAMAQRHLQRLDASSRGGTPAGLGRPSPSQAPEHAQLQRQLETLAKMRGLEALLDPHRPTSPVAPGPHSPTSPTSAAADCSSTRVHTPSAATSHGPFTPTGCRTATHPGGTPVSPPGAVTSNGAGILTLPGASASPVRHRHRLGSACLTSPGCPLQPTSNSTSNPSSRPGTAMLPVTDFAFNDTSGGGGGRRCSYSRDSQHHDRGGPATQRQRLGTMGETLAASWSGPPSARARASSDAALQTARRCTDDADVGRTGQRGTFPGAGSAGAERDPARHTTEALAFASEGNLRCVSRGSMRSHAGVPAQMRGSGRGAAAPAAVCAGDGTLNPGLISTWRRNLPDGAHAFTVTRGLVYSVFAEMDKDGTGILTYSGFEEAALNIGLREEQARGLFKSLDQRRCGYISVREWGSPRIERQILEFTRLYLVNTRGVTGRAAGVRERSVSLLRVNLRDSLPGVRWGRGVRGDVHGSRGREPWPGPGTGSGTAWSLTPVSSMTGADLNRPSSFTAGGEPGCACRAAGPPGLGAALHLGSRCTGLHRCSSSRQATCVAQPDRSRRSSSDS
ncbi:MAG: hypothetical protein WDW38_010205 [Sanguina aurantia]